MMNVTSDDVWLAFALFGVPFIFLLMLSKTLRSGVATLVGFLWKVLITITQFLANHAQATLVSVWKAHLLVFKNFLPRNAVLPSVRAEDTTRRD